MTGPPSPSARGAALAQHAAMERALIETAGLVDRARGLAATRLQKHEALYREQLARVREAYLATVPTLAVSRCPITGEPLTYPIDPDGLDGLWWRYEAAVHPLFHPLRTLFALTGALRFNGDPDWTPFLCKPGPEAPFVLPRLLAEPAMAAVVSSVPVGRHTGYLVAYFAPEAPVGLSRPNTWGINHSVFTGAAGDASWDAQPEDPSEFDFQLRPWIEGGRILWIAPGDASLTLRRTLEGCPYLDVPSSRAVVRVQEGRRWEPR